MRPGERVHTVLPDGCMDLVAYDDGRLLVAGTDTGPAPSDLAGVAGVVGVRFHPGVAPVILGERAEAFRDRRVPLEEVWGDDGARLAEAIADAPGASLPLLEHAVADRLQAAPPPDPLVRAAVVRLAAAPDRRVAGLALDLAISERQLRRRFHAAVGYGPKTLARVLRLQRLLTLSGQADAETSLARLAAEAGYADHAHMGDECVALTGMTPGTLLRDRFAQDAPALAA